MRRPSQRVLAAIAVCLSAIAGTSLYVLRRRAEQRITSVAVCLFGDPTAGFGAEPRGIGRGELPSERYDAIEMARPREKLKAVGAFPGKLVPVDPIPPDQRWPNRCARFATEAAGTGAFTLGRGVGASLEEVHDALAEGKKPERLDELFRADRFPLRAPARD